MQQGYIALREQRFQDAKQHFERAEQLSGTARSAQVDAGIAIAELQMGHYEAARQRESVVLSKVSGNHEKAESYNVIGTAWLRESGEEDDSEKLRAAENAFRKAVELDPVFDAAYFNLGNTLLRRKLEAEASTAFRSSIDAAAKNPVYEADLPLGAPAPSFTITDREGRTTTSESLRGRCVLLDFWATWCGPCLRALPVIRELGHYFSSDQFVLISVNEDSDPQKWRDFTAQQKMDWKQFWDKNADLYHALGLAPRPDLSIPRYVLLDGRGYVRRIYDGTDRLGSLIGQTVGLVNANPTAPSEPKQ
jgi:tetratricopeptide (TPR) repeat protein